MIDAEVGDMSSEWLTAEQVAQRLQVSVATIWRYTRQGKLRALRVGNHYRYRADQVLAQLQEESGSIGSSSDQKRMTYREFSLLPEQPGLQLIDGFLVKEPSPTYSHQSCLGRLHLLLCQHVLPNESGKVILAPFDVVLSHDTVLQPDILFVQRSRAHLIKETGLFGAPDLAIEILSSSTRHYDEGRKRELYLEHGCRELWIIDVPAKTLWWHVADGPKWSVQTMKPGASFSSVAVEGLRVSVTGVFDPA